MRIRIAAFTKRGRALACRLANQLARQGDDARVFCPARLVPAGDAGTDQAVGTIDDLQAWTERAFTQDRALLFVCACGIATRAIAPFVGNKFADPAVVCVDEGGSFAIPLLSGHVGGANALARRVAKLTGGIAAITTATDVNGVFAVDEWAATQGLALVERDVAKRVSAALLEGEPVGFASEWPVEGALPPGLTPLLGSVDAADPTGSSTANPPELGVVVGLGTAARPFLHTLHLVPRVATVGVGCRRAAPAQGILALVDAALARAGVAPQAVRTLASIDVKASEEGLRTAAKSRGWELRFHSAAELAAVSGTFHSSEFVQRTVGVDNVCERAACAEGEALVLPRQSANGVTVAIATRMPQLSFGAMGSTPFAPPLACVGLGPGGAGDMTLRAREALQSAQVIVGYHTYLNLIKNDFPQAERVGTGMRGEVERCRLALERAAAGQRVAVVCSGDPGIYGMAGLLYQLAPAYPGVRIQVVPGVTAASGGAAVLGAPLMHDWCSISLSDLMTPWERIEARLRAAAQAGFCIVLYNPASHGRAHHLRRACDVLLKVLPAHTVCGVVRNIGREGQKSRLLTLLELRDYKANMVTCVFVGNSRTRVVDGRMVTPRGYLQGEA